MLQRANERGTTFSLTDASGCTPKPASVLWRPVTRTGRGCLLLLDIQSVQLSGSKATFHRPFPRPPSSQRTALSVRWYGVLLFLVTCLCINFILSYKFFLKLSRMNSAFIITFCILPIFRISEHLSGSHNDCGWHLRFHKAACDFQMRKKACSPVW